MSCHKFWKNFPFSLFINVNLKFFIFSDFFSRTRILRANLLQPLKDIEAINACLDCLVSVKCGTLKFLYRRSCVKFSLSNSPQPCSLLSAIKIRPYNFFPWVLRSSLFMLNLIEWHMVGQEPSCCFRFF